MFAEAANIEHLDVTDLPTVHWPMWSRPRALAKAIQAAAARTTELHVQRVTCRARPGYRDCTGVPGAPGVGTGLPAAPGTAAVDPYHTPVTWCNSGINNPGVADENSKSSPRWFPIASAVHGSCRQCSSASLVDQVPDGLDYDARKGQQEEYSQEAPDPIRSPQCGDESEKQFCPHHYGCRD